MIGAWAARNSSGLSFCARRKRGWTRHCRPRSGRVTRAAAPVHRPRIPRRWPDRPQQSAGAAFAAPRCPTATSSKRSTSPRERASKRWESSRRACAAPRGDAYVRRAAPHSARPFVNLQSVQSSNRSNRQSSIRQSAIFNHQFNRQSPIEQSPISFRPSWPEARRPRLRCASPS